MPERTKSMFQDNAGNMYAEDQVVLDEKDGRKFFSTGNGGVEVRPIGPGPTSEELYDEIKSDRDAAKADSSPTAKPPVTEPK